MRRFSVVFGVWLLFALAALALLTLLGSVDDTPIWLSVVLGVIAGVCGVQAGQAVADHLGLPR